MSLGAQLGSEQQPAGRATRDPESPLRVTEDGYREAGRRIAALAPAVLIQDGRYDLASLGGLAVAAFGGAADGAFG